MMIQQQLSVGMKRFVMRTGETLEVYNQSNSGDAETRPTWSKDGEIAGLVNQITTPQTHQLAGGEEIEVENQIKTVNEPELDIHKASDEPGTVLRRPGGPPEAQYHQVYNIHYQASGVLHLDCDQRSAIDI